MPDNLKQNNLSDTSKKVLSLVFFQLFLQLMKQQIKKKQKKKKRKRGCFPIVHKRYEPIQRTGVQMYTASPLNSLKLTNTIFGKYNLEHLDEIHTFPRPE